MKKVAKLSSFEFSETDANSFSYLISESFLMISKSLKLLSEKNNSLVEAVEELQGFIENRDVWAKELEDKVDISYKRFDDFFMAKSPLTKECIHCNKPKKLEEFSKDRSKSDQLQSTCKECQTRYKRDHRKGDTKIDFYYYYTNYFLSIPVDYTLTLEKMIAAGNYDWKGEGVTSDKFPINKRKNGNVTINLVHFDREIKPDDAIARLDEMGLRPAEFPELLALGAKLPNLQRDFPIIAMGSVLFDRFVPYLDSDGGKRILGREFYGGVWNRTCRFAAVKKENYGRN